MSETLLPRIATYSADQRAPIEALYQSYARLTAAGMQQSVVYSQEIKQVGRGTIGLLPIVSLRTTAMGPALWALSGIHGEEPAGPMAIARSVEAFLGLHEQGIPLVLFPLCNPKGYALDWRYPNLRRQRANQGHSVGDSEHLLPDPHDPARPRRMGGPACPEAGAITKHLLALLDDYPPALSLDLHEDEWESSAYVYAQGGLGASDPLAREVVGILRECGFLVPREGKTRFGEPIMEGIVPPTQDGSIDELLSCSKLVADGQVRKGPKAESVLVVETPIAHVSLEKRVAAHATILCSLPRFWSMLVSHVASSRLIL